MSHASFALTLHAQQFCAGSLEKMAHEWLPVLQLQPPGVQQSNPGPS